MPRWISDAKFKALMEKYSAEDLRRIYQELEGLIQSAATDEQFNRMEELLAEVKEFGSGSEYQMLKFRAKNRRIFVQGIPPKPPRKPRKPRRITQVQRDISAELRASRRQEALGRQAGREVLAQHDHSGNLSLLARVFNNPTADVDLRKIRGRVRRASNRLPADKAADLLRRYEELAAKVQHFREVQHANQ